VIEVQWMVVHIYHRNCIIFIYKLYCLKIYILFCSWEELLTKYNLSELDLRDARYDAVIHLVTAANGAE